jgi:hypothetical protein
VSRRAGLLPALATALVSGVLGVQLTHGGGDFAPTRTADPCAPRAVTPVATGIEGLSEQLVLLGLDGAACRLGTSREAFVLHLAEPGERTAREVEALRGGLRDAVARLEREDRLPKASALADEALETVDLPGLVKRAIRALPDPFVDDRLPTGNVLRRTLDGLDVRRLLDNLDDPSAIETLVGAAVTDAVKDELIDGLRHPFG